jgi:acetyl-CoA synthetase
MLQAYGLETPQGLVCAPEQAATQAEKLGFPVTVKASSVSIAHKTEAGGVALNLRDAAAVRQASRRMAKLADEVLVERMVKGTVTELIIGITSDEQFGQALVIGAGGIFTELLRDSVTLILPVTDTQIDQALSTLKIAKLIDGFRNRSGDRQAVIRAISAVAAFAQANLTTLEELDVNPLMVLPPGEGAIAVDALIRMRKGKSK